MIPLQKAELLQLLLELIASVLNSQSEFEAGTKSAFSLHFSVLPSIVLYCFLENCSSLKKCFSHSKMLILCCFLYFDPCSRSCPGASCSLIFEDSHVLKESFSPGWMHESLAGFLRNMLHRLRHYDTKVDVL